LPLTHRVGKNAADPEAIWEWLSAFFADPTVTKIAHNLAFESQFLYARGIVVQEPCYDTIAAAQLTYKNEQDFRVLADCGSKTLVPNFFNEQLPSYASVVGNLHFDELDPTSAKTINISTATDRIHPDLLPLAAKTGGSPPKIQTAKICRERERIKSQ
jgi:DNA polymerase-1